MRGGWHLIGLASWFSQFGVSHRAVAEATQEPTFAIVDAARKERQPGSKSRAHAVAQLDDIECTSVRCVLPRPGTTFRTTLGIDVVREPEHQTRNVQASVSVLRHEAPYLFLAIETSDPETGVYASGVIRVKLYKFLAHKVDATSWVTDEDAGA